MVVYAILTQQSVLSLFLAAIIPAFVTILLYAGAVRAYIIFEKDNVTGKLEAVPWKEKMKATGQARLTMLIGVVMLGGIYSGIFTVNEGAAVGVILVFVTCLLRKTLTKENFKETLIKAAANIAMIYLILIGAEIYKSFLTLSGLPAMTVEWVGSLDMPPTVILLAVIFLYIALGCLFDAMAAMILTMPFVFPLVVGQLGYDPIWWGIMNVMIIEIGMITPPVGINIFVLQSMQPDMKLREIYRGLKYFIFADVIRIVFFLLFPGLALVFV